MLFRSVERGVLPIVRKSAGATSRVLRCISVGAVKVDSEDYVFKPFHAVSRESFVFYEILLAAGNACGRTANACCSQRCHYHCTIQASGAVWRI